MSLPLPSGSRPPLSDECLDQRLPDALAPGVGFLATLSVAAVLAALRHDVSSGAALVIMAAVVGLVAWWSRWPMALLCAGLAWLMFDGFVTDRYGDLSWHGLSDGLRLAVLTGCALVSAGVHGADLQARRQRQRRASLSEPDEVSLATVPRIRRERRA